MNRRTILAAIACACATPRAAAAATPNDGETLRKLGRLFLDLIPLAQEGALLWDRARLKAFLRAFDAPLQTMRSQKVQVRNQLRRATCRADFDRYVSAANQTAAGVVQHKQRLVILTRELTDAVKPGAKVRDAAIATQQGLDDVIAQKAVWIPDVGRFCGLTGPERATLLADIAASINGADAAIAALSKLNIALDSPAKVAPNA